MDLVATMYLYFVLLLVFNNSWLYQWGFKSDTGNQTITLPITYNNNYIIIVSSIATFNGDSWNPHYIYMDKTLTDFIAWQNANSMYVGFYWITVGY